jgi:pSer/pThr/pTyr-binding forkhead associated (FHA) protein
MASITVVAGPSEGDYYPLGTRPMVVGRDEAVPIQLTDQLVSRKHAQIRWEQASSAYHLLDMKSANGTFVNGRQVGNDLVLADGDMIELGNSKLMFSKTDFPDRASAMDHYKKRGERSKSTLVQ